MSKQFFTMAPKDFFFDRDRVIDATDRARRKALSKAGSFVMTRARRSMWRRAGGRPSDPGTPPSEKKGTLKRQIFFAYDPTSGGVVVGPVQFGSSVVPGIHEHGANVRMHVKKDRWYPVRGKPGKVKKVGKGTKLLRYPPRPYMLPALESAMGDPEYPAAFRDSVQG